MLTCRQTHAAVNHLKSAVWRSRYADKYDLPPGLTTVEIHKRYVKLSNLVAITQSRNLRARRVIEWVRTPSVEKMIMLLAGKLLELINLIAAFTIIDRLS